MTVKAQKHGHDIHFDGRRWVYSDTGLPPAGAWTTGGPEDRPCGHCGRLATAEGHDGCLGTLPGVENACCGHGLRGERHYGAYIQYPDGSCIRGDEALAEFERRGVGPGSPARYYAVILEATHTFGSLIVLGVFDQEPLALTAAGNCEGCDVVPVSGALGLAALRALATLEQVWASEGWYTDEAELNNLRRALGLPLKGC